MTTFTSTTKHINMKQITAEAASAFMNAETFNKSNTAVKVLPNVTVLSLFGNEIAYLYNDPNRTLSIKNCGYMTNTTKERLNGIDGVSIVQKKGEWYLNGSLWDGKLIDVN